jgi:hypothetical protein
MKFFLQRLTEPSTWAGLAALGAIFGIDPAKVQTIGGAAVAVAGAAAVFMPEKKVAQ